MTNGEIIHMPSVRKLDNRARYTLTFNEKLGRNYSRYIKIAAAGYDFDKNESVYIICKISTCMHSPQNCIHWVKLRVSLFAKLALIVPQIRKLEKKARKAFDCWLENFSVWKN